MSCGLFGVVSLSLWRDGFSQTDASTSGYINVLQEHKKARERVVTLRYHHYTFRHVTCGPRLCSISHAALASRILRDLVRPRYPSDNTSQVCTPRRLLASIHQCPFLGHTTCSSVNATN